MIFQQYDEFFDVRLDIEAAALPVREEDYRSWFYLVFRSVFCQCKSITLLECLTLYWELVPTWCNDGTS